jgi:exopolysaccharide biosynthesis polyprenyl glycosylphosphotransferase
MKKSELAFAVIQVPIDFLMIEAAAFLAFYIRLTTDLAGDGPLIFPFHLFAFVAGVVGLVWLLFFSLVGMYNLRRSQRLVDEFSRAVLGVSVGTMGVIIFIFLIRELFLSSRFIILATWLLAIIFVTVGRFILRRVQIGLYKKGVGVNRVVVIGKNRAGGIIVNDLEGREKGGYEVLEVLTSPRDEAATVATLQALKKLHKQRKIDQIIQTDPLTLRDYVVRLIDFADEKKIVFKYAPDIFQTQATNIDVRPVAGIPLVELKRTPLDGWGRVAKRTLDIIGSILLIIISGPFMLAVAIAIKLDSKGPIIYANDRVNNKGEIFKFYKFRSYKSEYCTGKTYGGAKAENIENKLIKEKSVRHGPLHKIKDDPRITKVGRFIRKTSLDELPQFFNVFKGDLSLVGPRPHMPKEVAKYKKHHRRVLAIKPGVTGLPQISGRSDLDFEEEVRLDTFYIENWSLKLDLQILFRTPLVLFQNRKTL